jgi:hypothetical protein
MLNWLVEKKGIAPHIPVFNKSKRDDGTFSRRDFRYDPTDDVYHCPGGKRLGTSGTVHEGKTLLYRASTLDCDICPLKPQCCPKEPSRKIPRDIHEHARDVARSLAGTEGFEQSRHERKKIEMRFAHLKRILKLARLRLRGPRGAQDEFFRLPWPRISDGSQPWLRARHPLRLYVLRSVKVAWRASESGANPSLQNEPGERHHRSQRLLQQNLPEADINGEAGSAFIVAIARVRSFATGLNRAVRSEIPGTL